LPNQQIRDAATIILIRDPDSDPKILMGQRGASAAFMPNKFVFPGGAVDLGDAAIPLHTPLHPECADRIGTANANAFAAAAIRELWEESGLIAGQPGHWAGPVPAQWETFAQNGYVPAASGLHFVFRAITPPGRPRRFDARFFAANADIIATDLDDFTYATDELSYLQWIPIQEIRKLDLPFITEVVVAEIAASLPNIGRPDAVPFFNNSDEQSLFERIGRPLS